MSRTKLYNVFWKHKTYTNNKPIMGCKCYSRYGNFQDVEYVC